MKGYLAPCAKGKKKKLGENVTFLLILSNEFTGGKKKSMLHPFQLFVGLTTEYCNQNIAFNLILSTQKLVVHLQYFDLMFSYYCLLPWL